MIQDVEYGIALMQEQLSISGQWLLVRLGLKRLTLYEWHELNIRTKFIEQRVREWKQ